MLDFWQIHVFNHGTSTLCNSNPMMRFITDSNSIHTEHINHVLLNEQRTVCGFCYIILNQAYALAKVLCTL
jgi:hypothetical protein